MNKLVKSTGIVAASTLTSRVLGFTRDILMANYFGARRGADVFFIAFMIPNLFRRLVAEGAFTISFIPVYTEYLIHRGEDEALKLAQKFLSIQMLIIFILISAGMIFSPEIMDLFFNRAEIHELSVDLTRIMFPYLFFVSFVAFAMGVLNPKGYFFSPAFAPVFLNIGMITGIFFLGMFFSEPLYGVSLGVILGGFLQILLQIPYLIKTGFTLKISIDFKHPGIRKIFRMVLPALFGFAVYQINLTVISMLAAMCPEGSVTYIYYTNRLTELVLGVFIVSIGNVILPEMSRMTAVNDHDKLKSLYTSSISAVLFLAVPAAVALMIVGFPIISVFFMRGEFTPLNAEMTFRSLFYASMGIVSIAVLRITTPVFYSLKDTRTPLIAAIVYFVFNITLGYILMNTTLLHAGLTLAYTVASTVQMLVLFVLLQKKIGRIDLSGLMISIFKIFISAGVMAFALWYIKGMINWKAADFIARLIYLVLIVITGGALYFLASYILGVREVKYFTKKISRRIRN